VASIEKRIIKREDGKETIRYYIRYYEGRGKKRKRKTLPGGFTRKHDAEVALRRLLAQQADGTFGQPRQDSPFKGIAEEWLSEVKTTVALRTYEDYEEVVRIHLVPFFENMPLNQITQGQLNDFISSKHENFAPRTINKMIFVIKTIFRKVEDEGKLNENPARRLRRRKQEQKEMAFLNREEIRRFLEASSPEYRPLFHTAIFTGAREGELLGLKWCDVELEEKVIYIRRAFDRGHYGPLKSPSSRRAIVITPELAKVVSEYKRSLEKNGDEDPVFQNKQGKPINKSNMISREFHPALERAGIRRIRFHDLRHTYGGINASMGVNPKIIQKQMGHSSITVTMDIYGHLMPEAYEGFGESFDSFTLKK